MSSFLARMLLERRAVVDVRSSLGQTRTIYYWAQVDVVRFLLEHGVDVSAPDMGDTPSKLGTRRGHQEIVELLSEYCTVQKMRQAHLYKCKKSMSPCEHCGASSWNHRQRSSLRPWSPQLFLLVLSKQLKLGPCRLWKRVWVPLRSIIKGR